MVTKVIKKEKRRSCLSWAKLLWLFFVVTLMAGEVGAQTYQLTMQQRRLGDMIGVEFWIKDVTTNGSAPALGNASLGIVYNTTHLSPAALVAASSATTDLHNPDPTTDSVNFDVDVTSPYETITSPFINAGVGYNALTAQAVTATSGGVTLNAFVLDINFEAGQGYTGVKPATTGKGTYIGMLKFNIIDHAELDCADMMGLTWNTYTFAADITIEDINGNDMEALTTIINPTDMTITGITILNPNGPNQAVNRDPTQALASLDPNRGYPIYFERSGLENPSTYVYGANNMAYLFEYSLDGGASWTEFGRVAESNLAATAMADKNYYRSGEIDTIDGSNEYFITKGDGTAWATAGVDPVGTDGYNGILRVIWKSSENFQYRSENAKVQITQLSPTGAAAAITARDRYSEACHSDMSNSTFVLGRLFFVQLDGTSGYFRTKNKFSNPTQLTVEAWINLNGNSGTGTEPAIVASASGESSPEEGAWMLYLQDGNRPAFRVRENEGRGPDGYIAKLVAPLADTLTVVSDAIPIQNSHGDNWTHVAATVRNGVVTLYVNGEIVAQETNTQSVNPRIMTSMFPIWVGVNPNFGIEAGDYLHAGIKEVKVWRYALPQDVLRSHISGVYDPDGTISALATVSSDERTSLELYYTFQGARTDNADEMEYQYGANPLNFYNSSALSATPVNNLINYRPDRSHIKLTSPTGGEGVNNLKDQVFEVRWVAYGLGSIEPNSDDIQIMVSRDGGSSWFDAIDNQDPMAYLLDAVEIEDGEANWEPYNGITTAGSEDDLQGVVPLDDNWSKNCLLRISGTEARNQYDIFDISGTFTVAPYFAMKNLGSSQIYINEGTEFNLTGNNGFLEAWIKPYRFPTDEEGSFPIIVKKSSDGANLHYALRLLPSGRLEFSVASSTGEALRTAVSDTITRIVKPNVRDFDSTWVHVGAWFNLANQSQVIFYIDGIPQTVDEQMEQLGTNITVDNLNTYTTFIGTEPISEGETRSFIGEMREVRYWSGNPGNQANTGDQPTPMTKFIQGALTIRSSELTTIGGTDYSQNLVAAFPMNGGSFVNNGYRRSIGAYPLSSSIVAHIFNADNVTYNNTKPLIKLVEPIYKQSVPNTKTDLRVRWVGFDFNRNNLLTFRNGSDAVNQADLKFGTSGGADVDVVHYQFVTSQYYSPSYVNSMTLPSVNSSYEFQGTTDKSQYALNLDVSTSDPDLNDDGTYDDYGPVKATLTNGRLQLRGRSTINGITLEFENGTNGTIQSLFTESPLFNITPPSNFTVRVLLEGYHAGLAASQGIKSNLGTSLTNKGLKIKLFTNNANNPGTIVDSAESTERYANATTAFDPANRNAGNNDFANVPFVFTEIDDGRYFVVVDHLNHLPIMSRYAAYFQYAGDDQTTWDVESGWDFQNWGGTASAMGESDAITNPPTFGTKYSAHGYYETDEDLEEYASTGLNLNDGRSGVVSGNSVAAMVGGDAIKDYKINGQDRTRVRLDAGGSFNRSDITGDGFVNGTDRQIVDRNNQKVSSLLDLWTSGAPMIRQLNPNDEILAEAPEMSNRLYQQAKKYLDNGGERTHHSYITKGLDNTQGALSYRLKGLTSRNGNVISVALYVRNEGTQDFALGNCSFGVDYDASSLIFTDMIRSDNVLFNDRADMGYAATYSGPGNDTKEPIPACRTIEVDYDAYTELPGANVPSDFTYLGTLRFSILADRDVYDFEWHPITVVHTVDGRDVTGDGIFDDIDDVMSAKTASILIPNGGEKWRTNNVYQVTWTAPTVDKPVYLDYSTDNGATWNRISQSAVALASTEFVWKTPAVSSSQCLVAIVDAATGTIIDRSDAPFAIMPSVAAITRPSSNDPVYKGNAEEMIKWVVDEQANIRFEFSADGSSNWLSVGAASVSSDKGSSTWKIPLVNTKNAVVRMINTTTGEVMAISEPFRILAGNLELKQISADNKVKIGESKSINWLYENVSKFDLQFSNDGGTTWSDVQKDVLALANKFEWVVPTVETANAIIRAIWNHDPEMEYSRTPQFSITSATDVEDLEKLGYKLDTPVPNPFRTSTMVNFTIPVNARISMALFSSNGVKVKDMIDGIEYQSGTHHVVLNSDGLVNGAYYIQMAVGNFRLTKEIILVR